MCPTLLAFLQGLGLIRKDFLEGCDVGGGELHLEREK